MLLNRDDVAARVTGPLKIRSNSTAARFLAISSSTGRFQLGHASAAAGVPQLNVRETGLDAEDVIEPAAGDITGTFN